MQKQKQKIKLKLAAIHAWTNPFHDRGRIKKTQRDKLLKCKKMRTLEHKAHVIFWRLKLVV